MKRLSKETARKLNSYNWFYRNYVGGGMTCREIASKLGCSEYPVKEALNRHGLQKKLPRGSSSAKRTLEDKKEFLRLYDRLGPKGLAKHLGCSLSTVYRRKKEYSL